MIVPSLSSCIKFHGVPPVVDSNARPKVVSAEGMHGKLSKRGNG